MLLREWQSALQSDQHAGRIPVFGRLDLPSRRIGPGRKAPLQRIPELGIEPDSDVIHQRRDGQTEGQIFGFSEKIEHCLFFIHKDKLN